MAVDQAPGPFALRERADGPNGDTGRERGTESEAGPPHFEQHGITRVDDVDARALAEAKRAETAGFVARAFDVDNGDTGAGSAHVQRARSLCGGEAW